MSLKMEFKFILLACCTILAPEIASQIKDGYWRKFNGSIPYDAVVGCKSFGYDRYIGRGAVDSFGLFIGVIIPGVDSISVAVPYHGLHTTALNLEIFCSGSPLNFTWISTNYTQAPSLPGLIEGGYSSDNLTYVYVGRTLVSGNEECEIGNIAPNNAYHLCFNRNNNHTDALNYEALI